LPGERNDLTDIEVGRTYSVRLDRHATQREFNKTLQIVRYAGGTYDPNTQVWTVTPTSASQQVRLGHLRLSWRHAA